MNTEDLIDILSIDTFNVVERTDTFLDIIWQGHKEVIISRLYAYFLTAEKNKYIANIFLSSLQELIFEKSGKNIVLSKYTVTLEFFTKKGNKIDILIDDEKNKSAVIIENKIYHILHNDLIDYWSVKDYLPSDKVGVLLTLNKCPIPNGSQDSFINITHKEWIQRIKDKGLPTNLSVNEYLYVTDFIKNIETVSKSDAMNDQAKFFFEHTDKVLKAQKTYDEAEKYIINEIQKVADELGWTTGRGGWGYKDIWDGNSEVYYIIGYEEMLTSKKSVNIIIQLYKSARQRDEELKENFKDDGYYKELYKNGKRTPYFADFATFRFDIRNTEIEKLGDFILDKIRTKFHPLMSLIIEYLKA